MALFAAGMPPLTGKTCLELIGIPGGRNQFQCSCIIKLSKKALYEECLILLNRYGLGLSLCRLGSWAGIRNGLHILWILAGLLENTLNYGLERVWTVGHLKGPNRYEVSPSHLLLTIESSRGISFCWKWPQDQKSLSLNAVRWDISLQSCDWVWRRKDYDQNRLRGDLEKAEEISPTTTEEHLKRSDCGPRRS